MYFDAHLADGEYIPLEFSPSATVFSFRRPRPGSPTYEASGTLAGSGVPARARRRSCSEGNRTGLCSAPPSLRWSRAPQVAYWIEEQTWRWGLRELPRDVRLDAHIRTYRHSENLTAGTFVSDSAIRAEIDADHYNLADPLDSSAGNRSAIQRSSVRLDRDNDTEHRVARAAFGLPGGATRWNAGMELAHESWVYRPVYRIAAGQIIPQSTPGPESEH